MPNHMVLGPWLQGEVAYHRAMAKRMDLEIALRRVDPSQLDAIKGPLARFLPGLNPSEKIVGVAQVEGHTLLTTSKARKFGGCELVGDVTVECRVIFPVDEPNSEATAATFDLQPANGEYNFDTGEVDLPPGEKLKYQVVSYEGLGV